MRKYINDILCDLDGVLTQTTELHAKSWKQLFNAYFSKRVEQERGASKGERQWFKKDLVIGMCCLGWRQCDASG